jgi:hypothetical protein
LCYVNGKNERREIEEMRLGSKFIEVRKKVQIAKVRIYMRTKAVPPTYIEERHRSFIGRPKGLSPTKPLGYSRKQYVEGNAYTWECFSAYRDSSTPLTPSSRIHVQHHPPTPPLPRSAPNVEAQVPDLNVNGYNYDYLRSPTPNIPVYDASIIPTDEAEGLPEASLISTRLLRQTLWSSY